MQKKVFFICIIFILFILWFFLKVKHPEEGITTIIKSNHTMIIAINYPKTKYSKLNMAIENHVEKTYDDFKSEYENFISLDGKAELNIDYEFHQVTSEITSITLYTYIDSHTKQAPIKTIQSFLFDNKKGIFINILDIAKEKDSLLETIERNLRQKYASYKIDNLVSLENARNWSFTIDSKKLSLYIPTNHLEFAHYVLHLSLDSFTIKVNRKYEKTFQYIPRVPTINPSSKLIALTFDDGPSKYTNNILNLLNKYKVNATFFVLGNKVPMYVETLKEVLNSGNEIGNHSYNHKLMSKLESSDLLEQINKTQDILKEKLGYMPTSLRPTYGSVNNKIRRATNLKVVLWTVDTLDWKIRDSKKIAQRGLKVKDGDIILMHDVRERTLKALEIMIPRLLEEGYQLVTVSELEEAKMLRKEL